jgi:hypothetical protein
MTIEGLGFMVDFEPQSLSDWAGYLNWLSTHCASRRFYHAMQMSGLVRQYMYGVMATT